MKISSAEFVTSAAKADQYPPAALPEIAFAGRSNVGKSSLINTLVNRKHLVKTSSTPGKTRLLNFFLINNRVQFVDLPGFGYAKVSVSERESWRPMVGTYLTGRPTLKGVVLLFDLRREPGREERDLIDFLHHHHIPCIPVLTKADKFSRSRQLVQARNIGRDIEIAASELICFSAKNRQGRDLLWRQINVLTGEPSGTPPDESANSQPLTPDTP